MAFGGLLTLGLLAGAVLGATGAGVGTPVVASFLSRPCPPIGGVMWDEPITRTVWCEAALT
ncbi:hypothetical protein Stsp02_76330 [Streptomyces sp. NBRC 14336]|nr:hypothetical protein Stsp02_76330 [Streptomyces sp. NBRC 14336]